MKAQLSLNVIIIASIVLIVLIVLWSIFTGRMGKFSEEIVSCKACEFKSDCLAVAPEGHEDCLGNGVRVKDNTGEVTTYAIKAPKVGDTEVCCLIKK